MSNGLFPEGIPLRSAPLTKRILAILSDLILLSIGFEIVFGVIKKFADPEGPQVQAFLESAAQGEVGFGTLFAVLFGLLFFLILIVTFGSMYFIYFESTRGATPGKMLMGLRVVALGGGPISRRQAFVRDVVRWSVDLFVLPALLSIAMSETAQRLGDRWAKTRVIDVRSK